MTSNFLSNKNLTQAQDPLAKGQCQPYKVTSYGSCIMINLISIRGYFDMMWRLLDNISVCVCFLAKCQD